MIRSESLSYEELRALPSGTLLHDELRDGVRFIVLRGPAALCAYVGVPLHHPLAGFPYDALPLDCHGGLTFSGEGDDKYRPAGWFWYGWDYGHAGDEMFFEESLAVSFDAIGGRMRFPERKEKRWLLIEVLEDARFYGVHDFIRLARLAERIWFNRRDPIPAQ